MTPPTAEIEKVVPVSLEVFDQRKFRQSIDEYVALKKQITTNFITGMVTLGEYLCTQRDYWLPKEQWHAYLAAVGQNVGNATQLIKLYEYSICGGEEALLSSQITGWERLHKFLKHPEDLRPVFAEKEEEI